MPYRSTSASVAASIMETRGKIIWKKPGSYPSHGRPKFLGLDLYNKILHVKIWAKETNMHGRHGFMMLWVEIGNWSVIGSGIDVSVPMVGHSL